LENSLAIKLEILSENLSEIVLEPTIFSNSEGFSSNSFIVLNFAAGV